MKTMGVERVFAAGSIILVCGVAFLVLLDNAIKSDAAMSVGDEQLGRAFVLAAEGMVGVEHAFCPWGEYPGVGVLPSGVIVHVNVLHVVAQRGEQVAVTLGKMGDVAEGVLHQVAYGIGD